ncbi:MAG TPA: hypothetical protein VNW95_12450 [Mucilaginibacter sp.]|jgi:hypothetical protein|nr:hypothetical protein [Mucilaginibacter sp.]
MSLTDEEFREEYKPLQVPPHFDAADTQQNKMIFALAEIGEGSAHDVIAQMEKLEPGVTGEQLSALVHETLRRLYEKGLLTGSEKNGVMRYNLHKITQPNTGKTNPG